MEQDFAGRVAFVTGAGSGIGRATAVLFAARGARVACSDINPATCEETVHLIADTGGDAFCVIADVAQERSAKDAVEATVKHFGRIDHAFNNAGVTGAHDDPFDMARFQRTISINLIGVANCMKYEIAAMLGQGTGTVVNTASIAGISGAVGALDYTAAKHGVVGMTGAAARRYGKHGLRFNTVCPGVIRTAMTGEIEQDAASRAAIFARLSPITGDLGEPDDIAEAVLFLSSDRAKFIHGVALPVDGGFSI